MALNEGEAPLVLAVVAETGAMQQAAQKPRRSAVQVRLPQESDWPTLREIVRRHHARTIFAELPFSEYKLATLETDVRNPAPNECLLVAEVRGQPVGLAWFSTGEYLLSVGNLMTTVHLIAIDAEHCSRFLCAKAFIRLIRGVLVWSNSCNARCTFVHVTTGVKIHQLDRLMKASGANYIGGSYIINGQQVY